MSDEQSRIGRARGETSDTQMGVAGAVVAGGVSLLFLPFLPVVAVFYLLRRLGS